MKEGRLFELSNGGLVFCFFFFFGGGGGGGGLRTLELSQLRPGPAKDG